MAVEELISRLERDAERRIAERREQAAREAGALLEQAQRRRDELVASGREAKRAALAARFERELAAARQQARAEQLTALHAAADRVLARARELFDELGRSPQYARTVARQTVEALRYVEGLGATVRCRPELAAAVKDAGAKVVLDPALDWGVKVVADGEAVVIDETLGARLDREAPRLKVVLARELLR